MLQAEALGDIFPELGIDGLDGAVGTDVRGVIRWAKLRGPRVVKGV
jgi:hypothetical protein